MKSPAHDLLGHLGVDEAAPSGPYLHRVHRAFVTGVTYDTIGIHLGDPPPLDPEAAAGRAVTGRIGYCFGMNGALWWLLRELGFDVSLHAAVVRRRSDTADPGVNHLTLIVHLPDGPMLADAGMGDGLVDPIPLVEGEYRQDPYTFALQRRKDEGSWRLLHDPTGSFLAMDFSLDRIGFDELEGPHAYLSTSPESGFVQALVLIRRRQSAIDILRSRTLYRTTAAGRDKRVVADEELLRDVLTNVFEVSVTDAELQVLWRRACEQHERFLAPRR